MFTHLIEELNRVIRNYENVPIIVEGKKDKQVLEKLGFNGIVDISGKSLVTFADNFIGNETRSVIILTDYDNDGTSKALQLTKIFQKHHIDVISSVRQNVRSLFKIHKIEELVHFTKFIELTNQSVNHSIIGDDYNGKISSIHDKIFNRSRIYSRRNRRETRRNRSNIRSD